MQGDIQDGDVVLFLFDGTQFWIQPNPLISADTTIKVPEQYTTVENALLAIRRKTIAQNARVTVLIAATPVNPATGTYTIAPFTINHANADRITIRGTKKGTWSNLISGDFAQSGNTEALRTQDGNNNIAMLRNRYGTEVQVPVSAGFQAGVQNVGPGNPTIQDLLITGPGYWSGDGIGRWCGVQVYQNRYMTCYNVSCWGLDLGYYGGGTLNIIYSFSSRCFRAGALATSLACFSFQNSGMFGGTLGGFTCNQNSWLGTSLCWANQNGNHGALATDNGQLTYHTSQAGGNAVVDIAAGKS